MDKLNFGGRKYKRGETFFRVIGGTLLMSRGKPVTTRKLSENTSVCLNAGNIELHLFGSKIAVFRKSGGMIISSCGFKTATTKGRLNALMPAGLAIYTDAGIWYVKMYKPGEYPWASPGKAYVFTDGMTVTESGKVKGAPLATDKKTRSDIKLKKRARKFVSDYMDALFALKVPKPSGADCWACLMKDKSGKPVLDGDPKSHILGHMEEPYYVPSMLMNAINEAGGPGHMPRPVHSVLHALWEQGVAADGYWAKYGRERLTKLLTAYIYRRLGFAAGMLPGHLNSAAA
ncbi:MAG: hypothetical protein WC683_02730 [bacterium]